MTMSNPRSPFSAPPRRAGLSRAVPMAGSADPRRAWLARIWLLLALASLLAVLVPKPGAAEEAGEGRPIGAFNLLAPIQDQLSGAVWTSTQGYDPRFWRIENDRVNRSADALFAPMPGPESNAANAAPLVPFRSAGPAFSRNQIITRQVGLFPIQTEPHIAVDPLDPEHLVLGAIDYNFPSMSTYVSIDGGETWDGPNQVRFFQEDLAAAGDPVLAFDLAGNVYMTSISIGLEEFQLGSIASYTEVSSMVVSRSIDGGYTWEDPVSAARSNVITTSNPDDEGKERGTITSAFLDKPWMTTGPNPENPDQDIIHLAYTEFATTYSLLYSDEVPYLSSPFTETTIRHVRSLDGGITWSEPVGVSPTVLQVEGANEEGEGSGLAQTGQVNDDGEPVEVGNGGGGQPVNIIQQQLQQQGAASFESNRTVQGPQPKVMSDGTVVVAYLDTTNDGVQEGLATIMVTLSSDDGETFGSPIQAGVFREPHFNPRSSTFRWWGTAFPQVAVGLNDEIYILTTGRPTDQPTDDGDILFLRSQDKGTTWDAPVRLNGDDTDRGQFFPSITVSPDGRVHAMWGDLREDPQEVRYHIFYTRSEDNGDSFGFIDDELNVDTRDVRVTDFPSNSLRGFPGGRFIGDYFSIAATDDDVYMVWADTRLGEFAGPNQQIGFARQTAIQNPSIFLNPPNGVAGREVTIQGSGFQPESNIFITLSDATIASARTSDTGEFTVTIFMPITGEGAQNILAYDETGNVAFQSYYTDYGFDTMQRDQQALLGQVTSLQDQVTSMGGTPVTAPPATATPSAASPAASPVAATPVVGATPRADGTPETDSAYVLERGGIDLGGFGGASGLAGYAMALGLVGYAGYGMWRKRNNA